MEIFMVLAIGALLVACGGLAFHFFMLESRIKDLEEWREEVEGDGEEVVDTAKSFTPPPRGNEDWRDTVL